MNTGVVVALITAITSLVVALVNTGFTARRERQARAADRAKRIQEREASAKAELDRMREPLLAAALDLAHRLDNIQNGFFFDAYLTSHDAHRAHVARTSTLYRFAKYWRVVEDLYDKVALLQFRQDPATQPVADTLRDIGRTFASDTYDGGRFMMWREEQRAIAERMKVEDAPSGCMGYATFVDRFDADFAEWLGTFDSELEATSARRSRRLADLRGKLAVLASQLDSDQAYRDQWQRFLPKETTSVTATTATPPPSP